MKTNYSCAPEALYIEAESEAEFMVLQTYLQRNENIQVEWVTPNRHEEPFKPYLRIMGNRKAN
jgi:hypothetical protein